MLRLYKVVTLSFIAGSAQVLDEIICSFTTSYTYAERRIHIRHRPGVSRNVPLFHSQL